MHSSWPCETFCNANTNLFCMMGILFQNPSAYGNGYVLTSRIYVPVLSILRIYVCFCPILL